MTLVGLVFLRVRVRPFLGVLVFLRASPTPGRLFARLPSPCVCDGGVVLLMVCLVVCALAPECGLLLFGSEDLTYPSFFFFFASGERCAFKSVYRKSCSFRRRKVRSMACVFCPMTCKSVSRLSVKIPAMMSAGRGPRPLLHARSISKGLWFCPTPAFAVGAQRCLTRSSHPDSTTSSCREYTGGYYM